MADVRLLPPVAVLKTTLTYVPQQAVTYSRNW